MKPVHRILYVRADRIGDVLLNLAALRVLRLEFPKAWLTLALDEALKGLLDAHPDPDEILYFSRKKFSGSWGARLDLLKKIKTARFDLAVAANADPWMHLVLFAAGVRERVGWSRKWPFFLNRRLRDDKASASRHEIESNLRLTRQVTDRPWDGKLELPVEDSVRERVRERLRSAGLSDKKIIAVHPGSSHPAKRWSESHFAVLCSLIIKDGSLSVVLIGGPEECGPSQNIQKLSKGPLVDWAGELTLAELNAFLGSGNVLALVSSDSGPVHIAWIGGTPVVALYAKNCPGSDPARWGPRDERSEVIFKNMEDIAPEEVYAALNRVLKK